MAYSNNCLPVMPYVHFFSDSLSSAAPCQKQLGKQSRLYICVSSISPKSCLEAISIFVISRDGFLTVAFLAPKSVSHRLGADLTLHLGPVSVGR